MSDKLKIYKIYEDYCWVWVVRIPGEVAYPSFPSWQWAMDFADELIQMQLDNQWSLGLSPNLFIRWYLCQKNPPEEELKN